MNNRLLGLFSFLCLTTLDVNCLDQQKSSKLLKIVALTSSGGHGHLSASASLETIFSDTYEIKVVNVCHELLPSYDPIRLITFGWWNYSTFYDTFLQYGLISTINFLARHQGPPFFQFNRRQVQKKIEHLLNKEKPDLLISVFSFINFVAYRAAQKSNIPFLVMTLDADMTLWLHDLDRCSSFDNFILTVDTKTPRVVQQLAEKKIPSECVHEIGAILRKDFYEEKNTLAIKHEWGIPLDRPVIMLIRGGSGSYQLQHYLKILQKSNIPLHVLCCVGKNTVLGNKLSMMKQTKNITFSVIPFTKRISDLMAVTDLLITSPSPNTCNEALYFGIPLLIDYSTSTLFWERATMDWIALHGTGTIFRRLKDLPTLVEKYLSMPRENMPKKHPQKTFDQSLKEIVDELISKNQK
jgi:processive 1,2-diacylglycerol beta-glucosyltransferase